MRKMRLFVMLMAIAAVSFTFTSCDDDLWDDDPWDDPYGWYDDYNHGGWGWNQDYWYEGSQGSRNDDLVDEAMTLVGEWYGPVKYSYIQDDGMSRGYDEFYANMIFYQSGNQSDALSGSGVEIDEVHDNQGNVTDQQTLKFSWYIDNNGDIYLKYASDATFVLDAGASQYGFHLGAEKGKNYNTFYGYMIGTGKVKGDIIYFDLSEVSTTGYAKKLTRSASAVTSFGSGATMKPMAGTVKQLNKRR